MFSFARERGADQRRGGLIVTPKIEPAVKPSSEDAESDAMDIEDKDEEAIDMTPTIQADKLFIFGEAIAPLEFNETIRCMRFTPTAIPSSAPIIRPGVMKGLASIKDITGAAKKASAAHLCLPMPVESSPLVALFMTKVADGAATPWKPRYISWMLSIFQLRSLYVACINGLIDFHAKMTQDKRDFAHEELKAQLVLAENTQHDRVQELIKAARASPADTSRILMQFVAYLEEYSIYHLRIYERFLFIMLIEPHAVELGADGIRLEHVITRAPCGIDVTLDMCGRPYDVRKLLVDFFETKVKSFELREAESFDTSGGEEYVPKRDFDLKQLKYRITVNERSGGIGYHCPRESIYKGYIDILTIWEYFRFCDRDNVLGDDFPWDPRSFKPV